MTRKLGIYHGHLQSTGKNIIEIDLKSQYKNIKYGDIVTDDMIEDYKDPLITKIANMIYEAHVFRCNKPYKSDEQLAEEIIDLINNKEK